MPIDVTDVLNILLEKDNIISKEQENLEIILSQKSPQLIDAITQIIMSGAIDVSIIISALDQLGYADEVLDAFSEIGNLVNLSRRLSRAMGFNLLLTREIENSLLSFSLAHETKLRHMFREEMATDLYVFAVESRVAGRSAREIARLADRMLTPVGRRAGIEVATALSAFDRATMDFYYQEAEVERFIYWGPHDDANRDSCRAALNDPRQQTGWTREDIANSPHVDFLLGGEPYFNCRHEWLPFGMVSPEERT